MDNEQVQVVVLYYGHIINLTKQSKEILVVSAELQYGIQEIKSILAKRYDLRSGCYITMINDIPLVRIQKDRIKKRLFKSDVIKIIPLISGG